MKRNNTSLMTRLMIAGTASLLMIGFAQARGCPTGSQNSLPRDAERLHDTVDSLKSAFGKTLSRNASRCTYTRQLGNAIKELHTHSIQLESMTRRYTSSSSIKNKMRQIDSSLCLIKRLVPKVDGSRFIQSRLSQVGYAFREVKDTAILLASRGRNSGRSSRGDRNSTIAFRF